MKLGNNSLFGGGLDGKGNWGMGKEGKGGKAHCVLKEEVSISSQSGAGLSSYRACTQSVWRQWIPVDAET